ncbi:hypothetical protein RJ55_01940 [Drechmeria coniospora]|nr:hypothetical protein RJ55_01940 [Drechmeria coniospora]
MRFGISSLAVTVLASAGQALSPQDIPADLPVSALLSTAQTHLAKGETSEALIYYDAAIAKDPTNYLTLFKRATTYLSLGRPTLATEDFNKVLTLKPGFQGAHLQLAKIRSRAAEWQAARAEYLAANKDAESPELLELSEAENAAVIADAAHKAQNWDECVGQAGVAILVASRSSSLRQLRAECRFERNEVEEGMGDLHHVLQMRPGDTSPHMLISATSFYCLGDFDAGLAQVRKCLHSDPDSKVCKRLHKYEKAVQKSFAKAEAQLKKGQTATAGQTLVGNSETPGLLATVRDQIAELRAEGRIPPKAKAKLYDTIVEMVCEAYSESKHKNVQKYCDEAIELDPDSFWGTLYRARALMDKEEYEPAIQMLEKAANLRPDLQDKVNPILNKAQIAFKRSKTKDYYKVIGVAHDADERQIKSAYRKASKRFHPDKAAKQGITKEDAEKKMAAINEAYEVLSNPELRARFDRGDDPNSQGGGEPFQGNPFGGSHNYMFHQQGQQVKFQFGGGGGGAHFGF